MIPEKVFERILVLGEGWREERVEYLEGDGKVQIHLTETAGCGGGGVLSALRVQAGARL